jgi:hypothetical protein
LVQILIKIGEHKLILSDRTIANLAEMICGASGFSGGYDWKNFPYRSSSQLTRFFRNCDFEYIHLGETRSDWVESKLNEINLGIASNPLLPSNGMIRVIQELLDVSVFTQKGLDRNKALEDLNIILARDEIEAYFDVSSNCFVRTRDKLITSALINDQPGRFLPTQLALRKQIETYLNSCSEDELIENLLVPLFRELGFLRVSIAGHKDKSQEYGKDLWMKYRLPTGHFIFFTAQVKKDKIDSAGKDNGQNVSGILSQIYMAFDHPILDTETNSEIWVDHVYLIAGGSITKQARNLLSKKLDKERRRNIIYMDRDELLDLATQYKIDITYINGQEEPF